MTYIYKGEELKEFFLLNTDSMIGEGVHFILTSLMFDQPDEIIRVEGHRLQSIL
jgi:hypothetical protein